MSDRSLKFSEAVREEIAALLREVKDPRVSEAGLLTVTHVRVSDDLGVARVLVTLHDGDEEKRAQLLRGLSSAAPFLRREIGRRLRAKKVPELRFHFDDTGERADRVETLLREIASERKP